jgi:hypothetical protein
LDFNDPTDSVVDSDLDGLTNLEEFQTGTDPTSAASRLALEVSSLAQNDLLVLSFEAVANRTYAIEQRPSLQTGSWSNFWNLAPASTNRFIQTTNTTGAGGSGFYRLLVSP